MASMTPIRAVIALSVVLAMTAAVERGRAQSERTAGRMLPRSLRRFVLSTLTLASVQSLAIALVPSAAQAGADHCPAPGQYCYDAVCSGACTTRECNNTGNCPTGKLLQSCYDCA